MISNEIQYFYWCFLCRKTHLMYEKCPNDMTSAYHDEEKCPFCNRGIKGEVYPYV